MPDIRAGPDRPVQHELIMPAKFAGNWRPADRPSGVKIGARPVWVENHTSESATTRPATAASCESRQQSRKKNWFRVPDPIQLVDARPYWGIGNVGPDNNADQRRLWTVDGAFENYPV
jgi:hypothetical protein